MVSHTHPAPYLDPAGRRSGPREARGGIQEGSWPHWHRYHLSPQQCISFPLLPRTLSANSHVCAGLTFLFVARVCVCVCVKTGWRERYLVLQHNRNQFDLQYFEVGLLNTSQGPRICVCGCLLSCSALSSPLFACGSVRYVHNGKLREKERESAHTRAHASVCMRTSTHECAHVYKHVCTLYNCKYTREYGHWGHAHIGG